MNSIQQLDFFSKLDPRPLPLIIADENGFPLQHYAPTQPGQTYQFSIQDWISGVGQTDNPRRFWMDIKKRTKKAGIELYASCVQLPYLSSNGRTYQMDFTDDVGLFYITQHMGVNTGIRDRVLQQMAEALGFVDQLRRDETLRARVGATASDEALADAKQRQSLEAGASQEWATERTKLLRSTHDARDTIQDKATEPIIYGRFHNQQYQSTLGHTAKELKGITGKSNPRDGLGLPALETLNLSNVLIDAAVGASGGVNNEDLDDITHETSDPLGAHLERVANKYRFDKITGKPRLEG